MERMQLSQEILDLVAEKRAHHRASADAGEDDQMPEKDRRNRQHVLGPRGRVKEDDHVLIHGEPTPVICPAPSEEWFYGLMFTPWGIFDTPFNGRSITDRAPADPTEEPLPIFIEDEPAPPEPEPA